MWRLLILLVPLPAFADSLVATRMIRAHTTVYPEDLKYAAEDIPGAVSDTSEVEGMETTITVYAGKPILRSNLAPAAMVERNQIVILRYVNSGLDIKTEGRALMRGAIGETIEVMNLNSRTKVNGQIGTDGVIIVGPAS